MMDDDNFARRFFVELNSYYLPVILPSLVIYSLESNASLKLWQAAKQTGKPKDIASDSDDTAEAKAKRVKAIKKCANRERRRPIFIALVIMSVVGLHQYLEFKSLGKAKSHDESASTYYLNLDVNDLSWVDILYGAALFFPTITVIKRAFKMIFGMTQRILARDHDGKPFIVVRESRSASLRLPFFVATMSIAATISAFWLRSSLAIGVVYASVLHLSVSQVPNIKAAPMKMHAYLAVVMSMLIAIMISSHIAAVSTTGEFKPYKLVHALATSEVNWAGLFISMLLSSTSFNVISLCYRIDHYVSDSEDKLVGPPTVQGVVPGAEDVPGTAITFDDQYRPRFPGYYFTTAFLAWLSGYFVLAAAVASGFIVSQWETSAFTSSYFSSPLMVISVFTVALMRGQLRAVWNYREDWSAAPSLEDGLGVSSNATPVQIQENEKQKEEIVVVVDVENEKCEEEKLDNVVLVDVE